MASHTLCDLDNTQTLTNKTLTAPTITNPTVSGGGTWSGGPTIANGPTLANTPLVDANPTTALGIASKQYVDLLPLRSYLAGCTLSTAGSSATMSIAAGMAVDSTNVRAMTLTALSKTTSSWAVGSGNGGLDTGSIANTTWYHFYVIQRLDTGVVDVLCSLSATAPTMPTNYTLKRRIGTGKTDGGGNWTAFIQDGDYFAWLVPTLDISTANPNTSAVTANLNVPSGITAYALLNVEYTNNGKSGILYLSDLATTDAAASITAAPLGQVETQVACATGNAVGLMIRTNTSGQIRYRSSYSDANTNVHIVTTGWLDRRGRDA